MGNHANINFNLLLTCIKNNNKNKKTTTTTRMMFLVFLFFLEKKSLNCPNEDTSEETFIYLPKIPITFQNFPTYTSHPHHIKLMERELYKVTTKLRLLVLGRWEKEKMGKMHALKIVGESMTCCRSCI